MGNKQSSTAGTGSGGKRKTKKGGESEPATAAAPAEAPNTPPPQVEEEPKPQGTGDEGESKREESSNDIVEKNVGKTSDLPEGQMKEVEIDGDHKALLVHQNGCFTAVSSKCTHYGAPLVKGYLGDGRVRCPWHGACFNVTTGDIEDYPGIDSLARYTVKIDGEDIIVSASKKDLEKGRCPFVQKSPVDGTTRDEVYVLVGGGPATVVCAETLRQEGFNGKIILCTREKVLPYDRPKLSKAMHISAEEIKLRSESFYKEHNIELQTEREVTRVDSSSKTLTFSDGTTLQYDKLLLATGAKPRTLPVPGFDNVCLLREPSQANDIATNAKDKRVVVIGTSFIGMEVASYLSDKATSVECIDIAAVPFERVLGERIGKALQTLLEEKGIKFHLKSGVKEIVSEDGKVTGVTLPSDETIPADIVVAGVGVMPATDYLKDSDIPLTNRGEVVVDEYMKVTDGVYAAGDIAKFPLPLIQDSVSIGHWQIAHNHGHIAGRNMAGKEESFNSIPYFWTVLFGKSLRYCGFALSWDEIIYNGNPEELKFAAYFVKDDKVMAVCSLAMDPVVSTSAELMYQGKMPTGSQLRDNPDLQTHL
ncbi:PREDICTED: apoptosis-inducing factor 3-like [Amphimedon queenslandica]|nr:PREDICTED: apoptosis-inducing factor 3-like [Amphimedon queenslandica]|eukprot:XP_003386312.1 PREDICTED: apoptosis-inducing factor 3-like [Amphimedon queenslandica]